MSAWPTSHLHLFGLVGIIAGGSAAIGLASLVAPGMTVLAAFVGTVLGQAGGYLTAMALERRPVREPQQ